MENTQTLEKRYQSSNQKSKQNKQTHTKGISPASFWVSLGAFLLIVPLLFCSGIVIYFQVQQLNLPGIFVYDKPVGLVSFQETMARIDAEWNQNRRINLVSEADPEISYWLSPAELGLWVDPQKTADEAFAVGRGTQPFKNIISALRGEPHVIYPALYFDETVARETLSRIENDLAIQTKNAQVIYQNGQWVTVPGSEGREVNVDGAITKLYENAFNILLTGSTSLDINYLEPQVKDLTPVLDEINQLISQEMILTAYDAIEDENFTWSVPLETKRSWISVNPDDYSVSMTYDMNDIKSLFNTWQTGLGEGRYLDDVGIESIIESWEKGQTHQIIIRHKPTTYTVSSGESLWSISLKLGMPMYHIMDANEGLTTNNITAGMTLEIPSRDVLLPLPVVTNKRIVVDISEQNMKVYEDGEIINTYIVSTGVSDSPTMAGIFQVQTHELNAYASNWDLYMPHFMGIYEAWPGFMNGIHGLPLLSNGHRLWASTLGTPASYGCIILDLTAAENLYNWADPGVVVEIIR